MTSPWQAPFVRDVSPAFAAFVETRKRVQREQPQVKIWCETRLAKALAADVPRAPSEAALIHAKTGQVHRCDVAKQWVASQRLDPHYAARTLISSGVRHSLSVIFNAFNGDTFALPSDVYPVYWSLAQRARVATMAYEAFPALQFAAALAREAHAPRFIVVCNPLKLQGRELSLDEVAQLQQWLKGDASRRLLIDGVYAHGGGVPPSTQALLQTNQVWLLDSMSKSWLTEFVLGAVVVPADDLPWLKPAFASLTLDQASLRMASALLAQHADYPTQLAAKLGGLRAARQAELGAMGLVCRAPTSGYLIPCASDAAELLQQYDALALSLEVFGSTDANWSIVSALSAVGAT